METDLKMENHLDIEQRAQRTDRLSIFREAVGITEVMPLLHGEKRRTAQNIGVFKRIVDAENSARYQYYASAFLINACLLLQIVFASALTALGASGSSHVTITVFGALNTVIAGLLSFTKGQGLPNRLRQYQNTLRKVREYIEQRERDFGRLGCVHDLQEEVRNIIEMYKSARENDENNDPSVYQPPARPLGTGKDSTTSNVANLPFGLNNVESLVEKLRGHGKAQPDKFEAAKQTDTEGPPPTSVRWKPELCLGLLLISPIAR